MVPQTPHFKSSLTRVTFLSIVVVDGCPAWALLLTASPLSPKAVLIMGKLGLAEFHTKLDLKWH